MGGSKFQYDESGTFYYFVLTLMALVIIPVTYFYWPRTKTEDETAASESDRKMKKCQCDPCVVKQNYIKSKEPSQIIKQRFIKIGITLSWIVMIAFTYKVAHITPDYVTFDPFGVLGIMEGASKAEIKKAYHKLSLVYHPDKMTGDEKRFMKITKAYAALTDETARKNWEEYGNPDGPGAMSFGIALPSWIVEKENSMLVLIVYLLMLMIAMPIVVRIWWANSSKYGGGFKVLLDTSQLFYFNIHKTQTMNLHQILKVLSGSLEFNKEHNSEIQIHPSDNKEIPRLLKEIPQIVIDNRDPPLNFPYSIKARALLYAHFLRIPLPQKTLEMDKKYILSKCLYLIQEFIQCAAQLTLLAHTRRISRMPSLETIENAMKLNALIVQGLLVNKSALLQLPHVNDELLRHFSNPKRNVRNMQQLAQLEDSERRQILHILTDQQYDDIVQFLSHLPLLLVDVRSEVLDDEDGSKITAGALVTVTVTLTRKEMSILFNKSEIPAIAEVEEEEKVEEELLEEPEEDEEEIVPSTQQPVKQNKPWGKANAKSKKNKGKKKWGKQLKVNSLAKQDKLKAHMSIGGDYESDYLRLAQPEGEANSDSEEAWDSSPVKKHFFHSCTVSPEVHAPFYPTDKQEQWWIYLTTDRKKAGGPTAEPAKLVTLPFLMTNLLETEEFELRFTAPTKPGVYSYTVNIRSDSYAEIDYFSPIKLFVHEAPKPIKDHPQWEDVSSEESEEDSSFFSESSASDDSSTESESLEEISSSYSDDSEGDEEGYELDE